MQALPLSRPNFEFCYYLHFSQPKQNGGSPLSVGSNLLPLAFQELVSFCPPSFLSSLPLPFSSIPWPVPHYETKLVFAFPRSIFPCGPSPSMSMGRKIQYGEGLFYRLFLTLPALSQPGLVVAPPKAVLSLGYSGVSVSFRRHMLSPSSSFTSSYICSSYFPFVLFCFVLLPFCFPPFLDSWY